MAAYVAHNTTFNTTAGNKSNAPTPAVGELIVVIAAHTGVATAATVSDNQGGTYTEVASALKATSADRVGVWIRNSLIASAVAHTVSTSAAASTGGGLVTIRISGMSKTGSAALKKSAKQDNQAAGTPAPVLASAALTGNMLIGAVFNATSPATMTPPSTWTEEVTNGDVGYSTPPTGLEWVHKDSGFTGTTVTWGSASASAFCSIVVELDTSASATQFNQACAVGMTGTVAVAKRAGKLINVGATLTPATVKQVGKPVALSMTGTPAATKQVNKIVALGLTGTVTAAATKVFLQLCAVGMTATVAGSRQVNKAVALTMTGTVAVSKRVAKTIAVGATMTTAGTKLIGKNIALGLTATAGVVKLIAKNIALTMTTAVSGTGETVAPEPTAARVSLSELGEHNRIIGGPA